MNWNSHEFIWLDWTILAVGIVAVIWAVWRSVQKDKRSQQGASSEDYLFGKGEPWYIIGAAIFAANIGSGTSGRFGRNRCQIRSRYGTLGNARLDDSSSRMAFCSILPTIKQ